MKPRAPLPRHRTWSAAQVSLLSCSPIPLSTTYDRSDPTSWSSSWMVREAGQGGGGATLGGVNGLEGGRGASGVCGGWGEGGGCTIVPGYWG